MRHRFHAICPYFAMFPEAFVKGHLAASPHRGVVFDPFCGRGTTVFQA
ncbi:MAG: site-specific DNA-methyltransferase, partial [Synechococcus sp. SB0663_bin_10]|nr:site-specific DNA-methyltransferase [Synechococcus sp. SB0663_bin_10]